MNYEGLVEAISHAVKTLSTSFAVKVTLSPIVAILLHKQAVLFYCFTILVFLDCFTRWVAISHEYLLETKQKAGIWHSLKGIAVARREGKITSEVMKHRFIGKVIVYLVCVMAAATADLTMIKLQQPQWAVVTIIGYLVMTELLSIVENLNDSGVEIMQGLLLILKKRKGV